MTKASPITLSISRQFGSGGGIIGRSLAKRLEYRFYDREIVMETARKLGTAYAEIEPFDEKSASFWQGFLYACQYGDTTYSPAEHVPSDERIHTTESEIILSAAKTESIVVVGRGANFVLENEPHHLSVFVHANESHRLERVMQMFSLNRHDALKLMHRTEASREAYIRKFTGHDVYDLRHYNLVIETGDLSLDKAEALILQALTLRFGEAAVLNHTDGKEPIDD